MTSVEMDYAIERRVVTIPFKPTTYNWQPILERFDIRSVRSEKLIYINPKTIGALSRHARDELFGELNLRKWHQLVDYTNQL